MSSATDATNPEPPPPGGVLWSLSGDIRALLMLPPLARFRRFVTIGLMPPDARVAIGLPWTPDQEKRLRRMCAVLRVVVPVLPERLRYLPRARAARAAARTAGRGARAAGTRRNG